MKFITTSQTPLYKIGSSGFYQVQGSIPEGTELTISKTGIDPKSERQIGTLQSGEIIYLDSLTRLLDEVEVQASFLWLWMVGILVVVVSILWFTARKK